MNSAPSCPSSTWMGENKQTNTIWKVHKRIPPSPSSLDFFSNSHCQHSNSILIFACGEVQLLSLRWPVLLPGFNKTQGNCYKSCQIQRGGWEDERMHQGCGDRLTWCFLFLLPHPHGQCDKKWELILPACSDPNTGLVFLWQLSKLCSSDPQEWVLRWAPLSAPCPTLWEDFCNSERLPSPQQ